MRLYDVVRTEDEEVLEVLRRWGVERVKSVPVASDLSEAKKMVNRVKVLFVPDMDPTLASLASQRGVHVGFFFTDVLDHGLRRFVRWIRIAQGHRVPILLASGARNLHELRHPLDVASLAVSLGMRKENALAAISRRWEALEGP